MKTDYEFIVIGAGGAGSAAAYELARRGCEVLLIEQFQVGHDRGSSHGHSRIFRFAYAEPDYVRLAQAALLAWRELEADAGMPLLTLTGGLDLGPAGSSSLEQTEHALRAMGAVFDKLDAQSLMRRFPQWRVPGDWIGIYSPDAGIVNPTQSVEVLAVLAQGYGARLLERTPVRGLELSGQGSPRVLTDQGKFSCRRLIVAAGAWLPQLVPQLATRLRVTQEATVFFKPQVLEPFSPRRFPIFINHLSASGLPDVYGFPVFGLPGVKVALHHGGPATTAEARGFKVAQEYIETLSGWLLRYLPAAAGPVIQAKTCLYTNTATHDFLIDLHPESSSVLLASPCSGHGFKFAPAIGKILADWALDVPNPWHFERFRLERALGSASS
ncbi:Sarcosine oxidase [Allomeiothermus silvanus DSM 9946]|uniref:Sarcosine oxidase n=1 Tax=Allomeiothermus silvanus (strain ATCC 700542 / DSM 9946 / NBRC 106475 / NCIMB 13440 / VI-R2) TaxID=526227 RepID=D7BFD0_ALLS1|nr:N-methyl-L-tryptophan oxidase [Allomeiothermus silvanus]ADH63483.1 Sarcosine oxidase [Allomeiothermus silvanus DSM 9946]